MRLLTTLLVLAASLYIPLMAQQDPHAAIVIEAPWSRAMPASSMVGAGYLRLTNTGEHADRLIGAASPIAPRVELHTHIAEGDMMRMVELEAIELPPGETVSLQPGGMHLMFIGLQHSLEADTEFPLTLEFEHAGKMDVVVRVRGLDEPEPQHGHDHSH